MTPSILSSRTEVIIAENSSSLHTAMSNCPCCSPSASPSVSLDAEHSRRGFLRGVASSAASAGLFFMFSTSQHVLAAPGQYEAMVLACIDPRFQGPVYNYLNQQKLVGKYSQFVVAGAGVGVVSPVFKEWHKTFWENLAASVALHSIKKVIVINHRDCGAARIAYGEDGLKNPEIETALHRSALLEFRRQLKQNQPTLGVETGLMGLDGSMQMFTA